ncbi:unnamed protein product, partial [Heterotrigona itama]
MNRFSTLYGSNNCTLTIYKAKYKDTDTYFQCIHSFNDARIPETIKFYDEYKIRCRCYRSNGQKIQRKIKNTEVAFAELATECQEKQQLGKEEPAKTITNITANSCDRRNCHIRFCKSNKPNKICLKCEKYINGKCILKNPM